MKILLTNDDGIYAPGLAALAKSLSSLGDLTVVAPDTERSAVSHAITLAYPIWCKKVRKDNKFFGYAVSGTPADCVKFGLDVILKTKPDLIMSGINLGDNDGCSVFYSGTVAGAREGALLNIPSVAVSLATFENPDFIYAARLSARIAKKVLREGLPQGTFLNVNIPNIPQSKIKGILPARQGQVPIHGTFHKRVDPNAREYYWMSGKIPQQKKDLTFDTYALQQGYVTLTPIHCHLTDEKALSDVAAWNLKV